MSNYAKGSIDDGLKAKISQIQSSILARGYKTVFMLNSLEHESFPAHRATIVGILTFMSRKIAL